MILNNNTMDFYQDFNTNKKKYGLNNADIAAKIDMKPDALRMAIKRESLSKLEIAEIEKLFVFKSKSENNLALISSNTEITKAPRGKFDKKIKEGELVRFYDTDFAMGDIEFYSGDQAINPAYTMDIPEFAGCTAFRGYGDSMEPAIRSGSILFGTKIDDWKSHLEFGQIYGIVCNDNRRYLKYIRRHKDSNETHFVLKSENTDYDDMDLPKSKIKSVWLIHGWLNKRT